MAFVSLKCQNCGQILEIDDTRDIGFCPYCGSKYQLAEKVKVEHSGTISIDGVAGLDRLIKKGFAYLNAGNEKDAKRAFDEAMSLDCDNIYVNIGMLIIDGNKYYYDKIYQYSAKISEEEKSVITDKLAQQILDRYCRFEDLSRIQYIIERHYRVIGYKFLDAFKYHDANCLGKNKPQYRKLAFDLNKLSHSQVADIVIALLQKQQSNGMKINSNQYADILNCTSMEYLTPVLTFLMGNISVTDLFYMMINRALVYPNELYCETKTRFFLQLFPAELLDFFLKNGLPLSTTVEIIYLYSVDYDCYINNTEKVPLSLPKLFEIPASGDKEILKKRVRISGSTQQIHVEMAFIFPSNMNNMQDLFQRADYARAYEKVIEAYRTNSNKNGKHCYIATAVYGSYDCPQVWTLRRYRDMSLAKNFYGRAFIKIYYALSPTAIKLFGKTKWFQHFWKKKLDRMVYKLNRLGFEDTPYNDTK